MQDIKNYELLQVKDVANCKYVFMDYDFALKHGFNLDDYVSVCKNTISVGDHSDNGAVAELLFMIFNSNQRPSDYKGRSMSVSDIIIIDGEKFYCNDIGFQKI